MKTGGEKLKLENFEKKKTKTKNGLEIWWRESYPENLAWIHAAVSEKAKFTDDGRLLTKPSRAKNGHFEI